MLVAVGLLGLTLDSCGWGGWDGLQLVSMHAAHMQPIQPPCSRCNRTTSPQPHPQPSHRTHACPPPKAATTHETHQPVVPERPQRPVQREAVEPQPRSAQQIKISSAVAVGRQVLREEVAQDKAGAAGGGVGVVGVGLGWIGDKGGGGRRGF